MQGNRFPSGHIGHLSPFWDSVLITAIQRRSPSIRCLHFAIPIALDSRRTIYQIPEGTPYGHGEGTTGSESVARHAITNLSLLSKSSLAGQNPKTRWLFPTIMQNKEAAQVPPRGGGGVLGAETNMPIPQGASPVRPIDWQIIMHYFITPASNLFELSQPPSDPSPSTDPRLGSEPRFNPIVPGPVPARNRSATRPLRAMASNQITCRPKLSAKTSQLSC